jgi:hypothetical protein
MTVLVGSEFQVKSDTVKAGGSATLQSAGGSLLSITGAEASQGLPPASGSLLQVTFRAVKAGTCEVTFLIRPEALLPLQYIQTVQIDVVFPEAK